jgi:hypothetical protein
VGGADGRAVVEGGGPAAAAELAIAFLECDKLEVASPPRHRCLASPLLQA